jgi:hypothetical protein
MLRAPAIRHLTDGGSIAIERSCAEFTQLPTLDK